MFSVLELMGDVWGIYMYESHLSEAVGIVEDEVAITDLYKIMLNRYNISISFIAYNGLEAVELFRRANPLPKIIIIDHRMPVMSGLEAMREIMAINPGVRVIFVSADISIKEEAMKSGAAVFLEKPTSIRSILGAISMLRNDLQKPRRSGARPLT